MSSCAEHANLTLQHSSRRSYTLMIFTHDQERPKATSVKRGVYGRRERNHGKAASEILLTTLPSLFSGDQSR